MTRVPLRHVATNVIDRWVGDGRMPFVGMEDVESGTGRVQLDDVSESEPEAGGVRFQADDVLFGKLRPYLRKSFHAPFEGVASSEFIVLRARKEDIDPRFLLYSTLSEPFVQWAVATSYGTRMPRTNFDAVGGFELWVPALQRQRRIAKYLDRGTHALDELTKTATVESDLLVERLNSVIVSEVTGRKAMRGVESADELDELTDFRTAPCHAIAQVGTGHTPSRDNPAYWTNCTIPWLNIPDLSLARDFMVDRVSTTAEHLNEAGLLNSAAVLCPPGTVFVTRTASLGYAAINDVPMATNQRLVTYQPRRDLITPDYLLWAIRALKIVGQFERIKFGATHDTVYYDEMVSLRVPLPPLDYQQKAVINIRQARDTAKDVLNDLVTTHTLLRERRAALITAAVTGELDADEYGDAA